MKSQKLELSLTQASVLRVSEGSTFASVSYHWGAAYLVHLFVNTMTYFKGGIDDGSC
jgi:hypothetical protein